VIQLFLGKNTKKTIMAYGMKYTKGGFPFKASPAKQDNFLKEQNEEAVKSTDYLTKTPNPTVASNLAKKEYNKGSEEKSTAQKNQEDYNKTLSKRTSIDNPEHKGTSDDAHEAMQNDHDTDSDGKPKTNPKNYNIKKKRNQ